MKEKSSVMLTITNDNGEESTRFTYPADQYIKGANYYYRYLEDGEGMGRTSTLLKVCPDEIRIIRQGDIESEQTFAVGEMRNGYYRTPQGTLQMTTRTSRVFVDLTEGLGSVEWAYELQLAGEPAGDYRLRIEIAPA